MKQPVQLIVAACLLGISSWSAAQWQWIDKDGRKVFSDRAPPTDIAEKNILKRPGRSAEAPSLDQTSSVPESAASEPILPSSKASGIDKSLEAKKKQAAQAELDKRKAEQERVNKARAENCTRAKQAKLTFDSGARVGRTNAAGEREIMDDVSRASEVQRLEKIIAQDCAPLPKPAQ